MSKNPTNSIREHQLPTTLKLLKLLESSPNEFREVHLTQVKDISFHEYLKTLMDKKKISTPDLISRACISKTYAYQFINGERLPGRDIVIRMAFALKLNIDDTQRLLTLDGKGVLYPKIRRDAGILLCLRKKMTLDETNSFLEDLGEVPLL